MALPTDSFFKEHSTDGESPPKPEGSKDSVITPQIDGGFTVMSDGRGGNYAIETAIFEGPYSDLVSELTTTPIGHYTATKAGTGLNIHGGVSQMDLQLLPAGQGKATITVYKFLEATPTEDVYPGETGSPRDGTSSFASFYNCQLARYDIPMTRYLTNTPEGDSVAGNPDWAMIHYWLNTENQTDRANYQYVDVEGELQDIPKNTATHDYVTKVMSGKETVLRFYPVVTRTSLWWGKCKPFEDAPPETAGDNNQRVGYICKPLKFNDLGKAWLKVQDDLEGEGPVYTRTESWMSSEDWDENFYGWGNDRWKWGDSPANPSGPSEGGS